MTEPVAEGGPEALDALEAAGSHDALAAREAGESGVAPRPTAVFAARRAELGMSLEDVANQLKFAPRQIEALETGDFARLPGGTFARGMMRSYARLLKIDPAPILQQLSASGMGPQALPEHAVSLRTPIPFSEGGKHVNLVYVVVSAVILAVVAFFAFEWFGEQSAPPKLAFVSPARDVSVTEPEAAAADATPPATFASAGSAPLPETAPRAEERKSPPPAAGMRRIVFHFDKESWVEVKAGNGETLISQMNAAGSERVIEGAPPFLLTIGNAPNVRVTYNEAPVDLRPHFKVDVARFTLN